MAARRRARVGLGRRADDAAGVVAQRLSARRRGRITLAVRLPLVARRHCAQRRAAAAGVGAPRRRQRHGLAAPRHGGQRRGALVRRRGHAGWQGRRRRRPSCRRSPSRMSTAPPPRHAGLPIAGAAVTEALGSLADGDAGDLPARCARRSAGATTWPPSPRSSNSSSTARRAGGCNAPPGNPTWSGIARRRRRPPATCSAPSPVRTPACRRRAAVQVDVLGRVAEHLRRFAMRARGDPVLVRRLRLVVPDDVGDPWRRRPRARRRGRPRTVVQR